MLPSFHPDVQQHRQRDGSPKFEEILNAYKADCGQDLDLTTDMLKQIVGEFKALQERDGRLSRRPYQQMEEATRRSTPARPRGHLSQPRKLPHDWGTAVTQTMVFGNMAAPPAPACLHPYPPPASASRAST